MKKPKILLVEDENISMRLFEFYFKPYDVDILKAINGKEALDIVRENNDIDFILMNYMMPIMNGIESTIEIRKFNKTIPIVLSSAAMNSRNELKNLALESGCNDYLSLPFRVNELIDKIETFTNNKLNKR